MRTICYCYYRWSKSRTILENGTFRGIFKYCDKELYFYLEGDNKWMYFQLHPGPTFRGRSFGRSFMSSENETRGRWQISDFPRFIGTWKSCQHSGHTPVLPWQNDHDTSMPRSHFHCPIHKIIKLKHHQWNQTGFGRSRICF